MVLRRLTPLLLLLMCAAKSYDGTGDSHVVNNPDKGATNFSVCFWIYSTSWQDGAAIVGYGLGRDTTGRGWQIVTQTTGALRIQDYIGGGVAENDNTGAATLSTSAWHNVCVTKSGTSVKFYFDATDATADATVGLDDPAVQNSTDDFYVGQTLPEATGEAWLDLNAQMTQVAYWDTALTGAQVASIADKTTCPTAVAAANLQIFLQMTSGTVTDTSANAFTVTENGGPSTVSDPSGLPCASAPTTSATLLEDY